jgi:hypothetical protein
MKKIKRLGKFKNILIIIFILVVTFIILFFLDEILLNINLFYEKKIIEIKSQFTPIVIKINNIENGQINYTCKFYDLDGNVIYFIEDEIVGQYFFVDFIVYKKDDNYFFFPYRIFSDVVPPDYGKDITKAYLKDGFPEIYKKKDMDKNYVNKIKDIYKNAINNKNFKEGYKSYGNAIHVIKKVENLNLSSYFYYICFTKKGGIELVVK